MHKQNLSISEIFSSIQGEGPYAGTPALFIRLSGCVEPFCPWCDTKYSWAPDGRKYRKQEIADIIATAEEPLIVMTGGEPFLQWENGLNDIHCDLLKSGKLIQYETSGKVEIPDLQNDTSVIVCSPKYLPNFAEKSESTSKWSFMESNAKNVNYFKFLWQNNEEEIKLFICAFKIDSEQIYLMPEGGTRDVQLRNMHSVWDVCLKNNWHFSSRLHTLIFDNKRGV